MYQRTVRPKIRQREPVASLRRGLRPSQYRRAHRSVLLRARRVGGYLILFDACSRFAWSMLPSLSLALLLLKSRLRSWSRWRLWLRLSLVLPLPLPLPILQNDDVNLAPSLPDGVVLCVHGGLSPEVRTIDQLNVINRLQEIPHEGAFCDMMWSDPDDIPDAWKISPRGATFACTATRRTCCTAPCRAAYFVSIRAASHHAPRLVTS